MYLQNDFLNGHELDIMHCKDALKYPSMCYSIQVLISIAPMSIQLL